MRVTIIGAGRVGLGALGVALAMQGHEVVFAARREEIVHSINQHGFDVATKGAVETTIEVRGVRAVTMPGEAFAREVAEADQIYTSVRPDNLPEISSVLAEAILHRIRSDIRRPLDVFCCENLKNAGSQLERLVFANIPFQFAQAVQDWVGFNAAISDRIVSGQEMNEAGRQVITADAMGDVLFDTLQVKGDFEVLPPFKGVDNFPATIEEKLYILNCGHAVCAYLGFQKGYKHIHQAMDDEAINRAVVGAMLEAQRALHCKHGRTLHYGNLIPDILASFSNAALMDTIARVGRDPIRKLQADDRLIGPAKLAYRYSIEPTYLIQGCAAALGFIGEGDAQSAELQKLVSDKGVEPALDFVSQLRPWNPISKLIREERRRQAENVVTHP
ncbi:MAG: 2-dehydropantoate 2-reductase N-terminal domain-containing protein [Blastocatellia bacterium]